MDKLILNRDIHLSPMLLNSRDMVPNIEAMPTKDELSI